MPYLPIAAAEQDHLVLLHYDSDFDLIAKATGRQCEWVVPSARTNESEVSSLR